MSDEALRRILTARRADILDLHLNQREEAMKLADECAEGTDVAAFLARAILAGTDHEKLTAITAEIQDNLKKLRRTPQEVPMMGILAHIYRTRLDSMKDAEDQYKRIKLAEPKNTEMLRFYCDFYSASGDWQRVLSTLQTLKTAVAGSYRELIITKEIAQVSEEKLNNPGKAVNVWNQLLKDGSFTDVAREELIGLYQRTQKWQALLEIYKNDLEAIPADNKTARIEVLKKSIEIYDEKLHLDAMVIKFYHQILDIDPNNDEAVDALIERYESSKRWNDLLKILNQKAENTTDKDKSVEIYYRIANLWSGSLGNVAKSIDPLLKVVELDPSQRPALRQLHEFYEQRNAWANLYDIIAKEADVADNAEKITLLKRRAEIGENNLHSIEKGIESWEAISNSLEDPSEALQQLIRLYSKQNNNEALLEVYRRQLDVSHSDAERVENLDKIADLYLNKLNSRDKAIETYHTMLDISDGRDNALEQLTKLHIDAEEWDALVKLYADLGQSEQVYELLDLTAGEQDDDSVQIELYERMAQLATEDLHDDDKTIAALEKILDVDSTNEKTARRLLKYYTERGDHAKAIDAIQVIIAWTSDAEEKISMHVQIADLYENELNADDDALNWYAKAVELAPNREELRNHFESLVERCDNYSLLFDVYNSILSSDKLDDDSRLKVNRALARACQQKLDKPEDAIKAWEYCLNANAEDLEAIDALSPLYAQAMNWEKLLDVLDRKLALTEDPDTIKSLSFQRAELLVTQLERLEDAEKSYRRVLEIDDSDLNAIRGLRSIYDVTEKWPELVEILRKEQDLESEGRLDIMYDLAEIERTHLNHTDEAVNIYAAILADDPKHERTIATLEQLIRDDVATARLAEILEPVYELAEDHAKQCDVLEIRLKSLSDADKIPVLWQIYNLRHDVLQDDVAAFNVGVRLFTLTPDDERIWDNLGELAAKADDDSRYRQINNLYADIPVDEEHSDDWRYEILRRRAIIVEDKLGDEATSMPLWEQLHAHNNEDLESIAHLEKLYKNSESYEKLVGLLNFKSQLSDFSDPERISILAEEAQIAEDILNKPEDAIRIFKSILDIDAGQEDALSALERLYTSNEKYQELAALYEDELGLYSDTERTNDVRLKLAGVCDEKLSDYERAIECYRQVLDTGARGDALSNADGLLKKLVSVEGEHIAEQRLALCDMLEPIYKDSNELRALVDVLRIRLDSTEDGYDKVELNRRISKILNDSLDDPSGAFDAVKAALKIDIADESLRSDFESLAGRLEKQREIIDLYESGMASIDDDTLKHTLYQRIADVYENDLQDTDNAIKAYRAMIELDDMDAASLNALDNLYTNSQNWTELIDILKRKAEIGSGDEKVDILRKMATINCDCLDNPKAAIENYRELLDNVADDRSALDALESLYTQTEDWNSLAENYGIKLQLTSDSDEKRDILRKMAEIQENRNKEYDEAIQLYTQILDIFPEDESTLDALDRLYLSQEHFDDLADILQKKLAIHASDDQASSIEFRLGQVYQNKLDSVEQAIEYYRSILDRTPDHSDAIDALRGLLENEDYRLDASRVLETVYSRTEQYENLAEILEIQLKDESDPYAQVELLKRIADIHQNKLTNYEAAFGDMARIIKLDQSNEYLEQIESLSDVLDNTGALVDVYKDVAQNVYDPELQVAFNNKIADLLLNRLENEAEAENYFKAALEAQGDNAHALESLDAIYTKRQSWPELLNIIDLRLQAVTEPAEQMPLLYRMADIQQNLCNAPEDAIATYLRVLEIEPKDEKARTSLEQLYEKQEMWNELADLLRNEISDAADAANRDAELDLKYRLAIVQNEKLGDDFDAIQTLHEILDAQPENEKAIAYLEKLFEEGNNVASIAEILEPLYKSSNEWQKLVHSLEVRAAAEEDEFSKIQILEDIAQTWLNNLDNPSKALETYGRIFLLQPANTETQQKVEKLASKTLELKVWADLYAQALNGDLLSDYQDRRVVALSLAKLQAERFGDHDKAREICSALLEDEPEEFDAYEILEWSYAQKRDYAKMLELWLKKADIVQDQDEKLGLLLRIATLQEEFAHDDNAAAQTYQQMLEIDQNAQNAIPALERLLRKTEQYKELADFYRQQSDYAANDDVRVDYLHKLGVVLSRDLNDMAEATEVIGQALSIQPKSSACKRTLESMLNNTAPDPENAEIRNTMATLLEPLYTNDEWQKLARVLDVMIEASDDPLTKVGLYMREAALYEAHDSHSRRAFATYAKAFVEVPSTQEAREKLEAITTDLGNYAELADVYKSAAERCEDDVDKASLLDRLATLYNENLNEPEKAAQIFEEIVKLDEYNLKAVTSLEAIYAKSERFEDCVKTLKHHVEIANNMLDQKDIYYRIATLQEESLHNIDDTIATYQAILDLDTEDQLSLDALERLYEKTENWQELILIYKRKIDITTETSDKISLCAKAAEIYKNKLDDIDSAIENYVQALNEDPDNLDVLKSLESLYTETKNYDDLLENIQAQISLAERNGQTETKHENQLKLASIQINNVDDKNTAIETLRALLEEDQNNERAISMLNDLLAENDLVEDIARILMPIYKDNGRYTDYIALCERRIEVTSDDFDRRSIYLDAANVAEDQLGDAQKAFGFISAALKANPTDDDIIDMAKKIAANHSEYDKLAELCESTIAESDDPDAQIKLSLLAADIYENQLNNTEKTIAQYERIREIDAVNDAALEHLHNLYKQNGNTEKLADVLTNLIDAGAQPINDLRFELAEIKIDQNPAEALDLLKQIMPDDPDNENVVHALEKLLSHKELVLDIAESLEPYYTSHDDNEKLAELLKAKIDVTEDNFDTIALLKQLANIQTETLHDEKAAFDTYVLALAKDPSDAETITRVEEIATKHELWNELADAYKLVLEAVSDESDKVAFYTKYARVLSDKLSRRDDALEALNAVIEIDPENLSALKHIEEIYTDTNNDEALLDTKAKIAAITFEMDEQKTILYQCAHIALNKLGQNERGAQFLEKIVEIDDTAIDAINPLIELYTESKQYEKLADLLNKKLLNISDPDEKFDTYKLLARVSANNLDDTAAAIEAYQNALDIKRDNDIYADLEALYIKHEQYQELDDLYMSQLDTASDSKQKADLRIKRAKIARDHFNDDMQAADLLKDALHDNPASAEAFNMLDQIFSSTGNFQELFDLLNDQIASASDPDVTVTLNIRKAKLAATHLGDVDTAINSLTDVLNAQPNNLEAINSLIDIHVDQKSYDLALGMLKRKLECMSTDTEKSQVYCDIAEIIRKANWGIEPVEQSYTQALAHDKNNETALNALLDIAKDANNVPRQLELLNVKADNQTDVEARNEILLKIADTASQSPDCYKYAADALAKIYAGKKDDIELGEKLVNAYLKAGDTDSATPVLSGIIDQLVESKQNKKLPPFYSLQGRLAKQKGDIDGARQAFEAAYAIDKNNIPNNLELGKLLYDANDYDAALKIMQSLLLHQMNIKDNDVKTEIFYYMGMLRVKKDDPKRAKDMFNRALGVNPNHEPTKAALAELG